MKHRILRPATREEWLELRKGGIGSSEIGVLARVSKFDTIVGLWRKKMGLVPPTEETEAMAVGHQFENYVALMYQEQSGDVMDETSVGDWIAQSVEKPYLQVSPDRLFWNKDIPAGQRTIENSYIVECKTTSMMVSPDDFPKSWFFQVQYQMGVMGMKKAVIAWITSNPRLRFGFVEVPFNAVVFDEIVRTIDKFWNEHVMTGIIPQEVMNESDASYVWPDAKNTYSVATTDLAAAVEEYNNLNAESKAIEGRMEAIKLQVKTFMQENEELRNEDNNIICTWRNSNVADSFDSARFAAEHPDMYKEYLNTGKTCRRLLFRKSPGKADKSTATAGEVNPALVVAS